MSEAIPFLAYGVWIPGGGWLKHGNRAFGDTRERVAQSAAWLYGSGAIVLPIDAPDAAMLDLESVFLAQEQKRERERQDRRALNRIRRVWRGLLGYLGQRKSK